MTRENDLKRFKTIQEKYGILCDVNEDLNEKLTKLQAKYNKLIKALRKLDNKTFDIVDFETTLKIRNLIKKENY